MTGRRTGAVLLAAALLVAGCDDGPDYGGYHGDVIDHQYAAAYTEPVTGRVCDARNRYRDCVRWHTTVTRVTHTAVYRIEFRDTRGVARWVTVSRTAYSHYQVRHRY